MGERWRSAVVSPVLCCTLRSSLPHSISLRCPTILTDSFYTATITFLPESYVVRNQRLAVTRPISNLLHPAYDHRCISRSLRYLGLHPPVSYVLERKDDARSQKTDFRSKPGFTSSRPRMYMFGITTFIFALAIIALALEKTIQARQRKLILDPSLSDSSQLACIYAWAAITSVTVRL
jgi:hypothetical protein